MALAWAAATALAALPGAADDTGGVAVVARDAAGVPTALRISSELAEMGIAVRTYPPGSLEGDAGALAAIGARIGAEAVIRLGEGGGAEVWTARFGSNETVPVAPGDPEGRMLAIAASELVRARLLGGDPPPEPAAAPAPPGRAAVAPAPAAPAVAATEGVLPAPVRELPARERPTRERPARLTAGIGPAVVAAGLTMAPTMNLLVGAALVIVRPLSVELFGVTPLVRATASVEAGSMRVHTALAGGGLQLGWSPGAGRVRLYAAPGFAALFVVLDADPAAGYEAREETAVAALPLLRAGASVALSSRLRLDLAAFAGVALSELIVRMGDREAARFGRPALGGALSLEVVLW